MANVSNGFSSELVGDNFHLNLNFDYQLRGYIDGESVEFDGTESGYNRQVEHFVKAVETNDQSLVRSGYADALKILAVTVAANRSIQTGQVEEVEVKIVYGRLRD